MPRQPDPFIEIRAEVRRLWGRVTPYRLGVAVGRAGLDLKSPYPYGSRGSDLYLEGKVWGAAKRHEVIR